MKPSVAPPAVRLAAAWNHPGGAERNILSIVLPGLILLAPVLGPAAPPFRARDRRRARRLRHRSEGGVG